MKYMFLATFVIVSAIHLYGSWISNKKIRAWSKVFILLALLGWYCSSAALVQWVVVAALLASWLGDVLLIRRGVQWLTAGGISFMLSHVFFVLAFYPNINFQRVPIWTVAFAAAVYVIVIRSVFSVLKPHLSKGIFLPLLFYLSVNGVMNCFAFYQLVSNPCLATVATFAGALLFFASDSILFFVRFKKDSVWKSHFPVMLTYILAEFLIVWGIVMLCKG